jgi:GNAT superfamily N-acetyltransferase
VVTPQARAAGKADIRELTATLSRAFYDDPVSTWILPDDNARSKHLARVFAAMTRHHHFGYGGVEVACNGAGIGAAALWDPPNHWQETRRAELAMTPALLRVFGLRTAVARGVQEAVKRVHPEEPHWYLAVLGSDPAVRGKGFGQVLMRSRLHGHRRNCAAQRRSDVVGDVAGTAITVTGYCASRRYRWRSSAAV